MFRPGSDPIGNLAAALNSPGVLEIEGEFASTNKVLLEATLRRGSLGLVDAVCQARIPSHDNLLIVVDQFEELFRFRTSTLVKNSRDEALAFFKLLLEAVRQADLPIYVVLTMRADFIGECMEFPGLPESVNSGIYLVPRMTRDELRSAITGPVAVAGAEIEQRLVLRLLNDLGDEQDRLPVLQHALMRTWDYWEAHHKPGDENRKHDELCNQKRRLFLRWRQCLQSRHLLEGLHNEDEGIEVEGESRADHVDPAPGSREVKGVARQNSHRQHHQRNGADNQAWR
jgi:hypothetical protein